MITLCPVLALWTEMMSMTSLASVREERRPRLTYRIIALPDIALEFIKSSIISNAVRKPREWLVVTGEEKFTKLIFDSKLEWLNCIDTTVYQVLFACGLNSCFVNFGFQVQIELAVWAVRCFFPNKDLVLEVDTWFACLFLKRLRNMRIWLLRKKNKACIQYVTAFKFDFTNNKS